MKSDLLESYDHNGPRSRSTPLGAGGTPSLRVNGGFSRPQSPRFWRAHACDPPDWSPLMAITSCLGCMFYHRNILVLRGFKVSMAAVSPEEERIPFHGRERRLWADGGSVVDEVRPDSARPGKLIFLVPHKKALIILAFKKTPNPVIHCPLACGLFSRNIHPFSGTLDGQKRSTMYTRLEIISPLLFIRSPL